MKAAARIPADDPSAPGRAAEVLRSGGIVAFPTESWYGLGVDPFNEDAVTGLSTLKGREASSPFPLIAGSTAQVEETFGRLTGPASILARVFWPGALTLALPAPRGIHAGVVSSRLGAGVRVPGNELARALPLRFGSPITATSANRSGLPPAGSAEDVVATLGAGVQLVLDGGPAPGGLPSTVLDLTGIRPVLIREGAVSPEAIERALGTRLQRDLQWPSL